MTGHEKDVLEVVRQHLSITMSKDVQVFSYPEEASVPIPQGEKPCDVIWGSDPTIFSVEHTTLDSFPNQRADDDRFRKVMERLARRWSAHPDETLEIAIDVGSIPSGINWSVLSEEISDWLVNHICDFPLDQPTQVSIPGIPFDLHICRERTPGVGRVFVMRHAPDALASQRALVVRTALDSNKEKMQQYKYTGYRTILVLESQDFVLHSRVTLFEALRSTYQEETHGTVYDEIYLITTGTNPWCVFPFKIGSELKSKAKPYWPTAPGYPLA